MIHTHILHTSEVDRCDAAIADISTQLAAVSLRQNAVGIVVCHHDFVENGIVAALAEMLPFPVIGITTFYQKTPVASGLFQLTITVLTSDEVRFTMASSDSSEGDILAPSRVKNAYAGVYAGGGAPPRLILSFLSANRPVTGDEYLRLLDVESGGVPSFGFVNSGEEDHGSDIYVICGSQVFSNGFALLALDGIFDMETFIGVAPEERLLAVSPEVTAAEGCTVMELNGQPAAVYLKKNGVDLGGGDEAFMAVPFQCRIPGEDRLVGRTLATIRPDGALVFLGEVPVGALLRIDTVTADGILEESHKVLLAAEQARPDASVFMIGSCVGRFITLGLDTTAELDYAAEALTKGRQFLACYVGGEICPITADGFPINRYHNNSFIVLALG